MNGVQRMLMTGDNCVEVVTAPPTRAAQEGWAAFDEGWSSYSNPYPPRSPEAAQWGYAWDESAAGAVADRALAAGADPEDYK